jgi:hypothetical protein
MDISLELLRSIDRHVEESAAVAGKSELSSIDALVAVAVAETIKEELQANPQPDASAEYAKHTQLYRQFHDELMSEYSKAGSVAEYYFDAAEEKQEFEWGDELMGYEERKDFIRAINMNKLLGGEHNGVDPRAKERYEQWKLESNFNFLLSTFYYDTFTRT